MARFDTTGLDDMIDEMRRMGQDVGPVAEEMVMAAVEEIREVWRASAKEHGHDDTGSMIESIGFNNAPVRASSVIYNDVYPQGNDGRGVRNATKAFVLNYGTSKIPPSHWIDEADDKSAEPVQTRLESIWDRFLSEHT